jgi:hypothetical protein
MSTSEKPQKLSIGFHGGQVLSARVKPAELTKLRETLTSERLARGGWHELVGEDGTALLDLTKIDYVLFDNDEHRIGF